MRHAPVSSFTAPSFEPGDITAQSHHIFDLIRSGPPPVKKLPANELWLHAQIMSILGNKIKHSPETFESQHVVTAIRGALNDVLETIIAYRNDNQRTEAAASLLLRTSVLTCIGLKKGLISRDEAAEFEMIASNGTSTMPEKSALRLIGQHFLQDNKRNVEVLNTTHPTANAADLQSHLSHGLGS
jgi:hypothetical protein